MVFSNCFFIAANSAWVALIWALFWPDFWADARPPPIIAPTPPAVSADFKGVFCAFAKFFLALSFAPFIDFEILSFLPLRRPFKFGDLNFLRGFVSFVEIPLRGDPLNPLNPPILLRLTPFVGSFYLDRPLTKPPSLNRPLILSVNTSVSIK